LIRPGYDKGLQTPHLLSRSDLASQAARYIETFNLNSINSAKIQSTRYDPSTERWQIKFQTPAGQRKAVSKHLVLATGIGSQKPNIPQIEDKDLYQGINLHSAQYQNAKQLVEKGAKVGALSSWKCLGLLTVTQSVLVIGSANTAFDVLEDCHAAGLQPTMNVRSPTYIVPIDYICHKMSLGAYDFGVEAADNLFMTLPTSIDGQLSRGLFATFASQEPKRYEALKAVGFPVLDSSHHTSSLMHHLLEKAGGHYVDVGGTKLLEEGKAGIKADVEPVAYTATGLRFV
jgi:cation diffusion facilitator CzcD-associated flavoprotein CzcO